jgi:hypothetical protein
VLPSTHNANILRRWMRSILRLLSKNPEDRPATAGEVLAALDRLIRRTERVRHPDPPLSPLDRLARGRLVGRQAEFNRVKTPGARSH